MTLFELIAKLEQASGPDRELDAEIAVAVNARPDWAVHMVDFGLTRGPGIGRVTVGPALGFDARRYTASLDAALTLVPASMNWMTRNSGPWDSAHPYCAAYVNSSQYQDNYATAKTASLALCIAALRARAQDKQP